MAGLTNRREVARVAAEEILELSRGEIIGMIETEARRRRGLTASQLVRAYAEGMLEAPGEVADLLALADLLPEGDPLFGSRPT
jgi:hypothetical protein